MVDQHQPVPAVQLLEFYFLNRITGKAQTVELLEQSVAVCVKWISNVSLEYVHHTRHYRLLLLYSRKRFLSSNSGHDGERDADSNLLT